MAKHSKRKKKTTTRRRSRVGAAGVLNPASPLVKFGSIALGYFMLGDKINAKITEAAGDKVDGKLIGAAEGGLGYMLSFGKGKKSLIKTIAGGILLGSGAKLLMGEMGVGAAGPYGRVPVIAGPYGNVPVIAGSRRRVGAYTPNNALNGYSPNQSLASKIMSGVSTSDNGSGSGITASPGSDMMS